MRLMPNPWFALPVIVAAVVGNLIGRNFARVSCAQVDPSVPPVPCPGRELGWGIGAAIFAAIGVAVVIVLAIRSLREWREYEAGERERPEPGCEAAEDR